MSHTDFQPDLCIRYVEDTAASTAFYAGLFGRSPLFVQDGFTMFRFDTGLRLGLWARGASRPQPLAGGGGAELAILAQDAHAVEAAHRDWAARGIAILQPPADADFGRTFVAADPDGHRIRVYASAPR